MNRLKAHLFPKFGEACDSEFGDAARDDTGEMRQIRRHIDGKTMKRHPALHADSKGADLRLLLALADPDADSSGRAMRGHAQLGERVDHPAFEAVDEAANVFPALFKVEHHIADALARTVIGI